MGVERKGRTGERANSWLGGGSDSLVATRRGKGDFDDIDERDTLSVIEDPIRYLAITMSDVIGSHNPSRCVPRKERGRTPDEAITVRL